MGAVSAAAALPAESHGLANSIDERRSQDLVFAFVGPIASGVSTASAFLKEILEQRFAYAVCPTIKLSEFIKREAHRVNRQLKSDVSFRDYISSMQSAGNELREKFGADYLAKKAVEQIVKFKKANGGFSDDGKNLPLPGRRAFIIDSVKNAQEVTLLKSIYGEALCLIGVFAPDLLRRERLINNSIPADAVVSIVDRDAGEVETFGQMTRKIFVEADLFIRNDLKPTDLRARLERFLNLLFDTAIHTPTRSEAAMYEAGAAALSSGCMSRQVGSAILSASGELISIGWNDVPRYGGGLYSEEDQHVYDDAQKGVVDRDHRCFKWGGNICHNESRRTGIISGVVERLKASGLLRDGTTDTAVLKALSGTPVDALIEYSRSIHAEMEAILAVAREGKHSLVGSTLFVTTYPCHNCARHIVATGIKEVIYIEPYKKSLATDLHSDSVSEVRSDSRHVIFSQYDGVAPRNFLKLFRAERERKRSGKLFREPPTRAEPLLRIPLDGPADYEAKVIADLTIKEQTPIHHADSRG